MAAVRVVPARWEGNNEPGTVEVWQGDENDGSRTFAFELKSGPLVTTHWTTREGIEAIRDACNAALVKDDIERDARRERFATVERFFEPLPYF